MSPLDDESPIGCVVLGLVLLLLPLAYALAHALSGEP